MTHRRSARDVFGNRASYYTTSPVHVDPANLADLVGLAHPKPHWYVLDVATGTGHTAFAFAPLVKLVVGLDLTPEMLAEAMELRRRKGLTNVQFCQGDAHALPCSSGSLDLITCRRAAHHFADLPLALSEAHRALRPGGLLLVHDRSVPEDDFVDATMNRLDRLHDPSHVREYRPSEWAASLEGAGFSLEHLSLSSQHRPVSSLTDNAGPAEVAEILSLLQGLTEPERWALNLTGAGPEMRTDHWYVTALARRA
ncbi:MAG: class I SAM-dependent methyltransferase [Anaerolineae bacterium]|nr:class I SAM-dependent methyltransferase [Anaerolineae bacterium]